MTEDTTTETGDGWVLSHGDCIEILSTFKDNSIDYSVFSPPFASLYTFSDMDRDLGNCRDSAEFFEHFEFVSALLYKKIKPGRLVSTHSSILTTSKVRDGRIALYDFRGDLIRNMEAAGFHFHSEVCIWKCPVNAMYRTKALGLLHKTIRNDSSRSRQGTAEYVTTFRKPGENTERIQHDADVFPVSLWQKWAEPIWTDIDPSDTLQYRNAREHDDERHICPLQLEVIKRCLGLWTNPGDLVLSPFAGIGSEGHEALKWGRRYVGIELKESYFKQAVANLRAVDTSRDQFELFS